MTQATGTLDLDALAELYDDHAVRTATYHDRDLTDAERLNLALQGLTEVYRNQDRSVADYERASDVLEQKLKAGETVGRALVETVRELEG